MAKPKMKAENEEPAGLDADPAATVTPSADAPTVRGSNHATDGAAQLCDVTITDRVRPVKAATVALKLADGRSPSFKRKPPTTKAIKLTPDQQRDLSAHGWAVAVKE